MKYLILALLLAGVVMLERLTDCTITMYGKKTYSAWIWVLLDRVFIAFGQWPRWESAMIGINRSEGPAWLSIHVTWPLPDDETVVVLYETGLSFLNDEHTLQLDVSFGLFQLIVTHNKV